MFNFAPDPIFINLGPFAVHWYGVILSLSGVAGFLVTKKLFKKYSLSLEHLNNLTFYIIVFGFIGARIYHVLNEPAFYFANPAQIIAVWNGGLAIHGALIAGVLVVIVYARRHLELAERSHTEKIARSEISPRAPSSRLVEMTKGKVWFLLDIFAPGLLFAQGLGRWGNFFNQELYGRPVYEYGIFIEPVNRLPGFQQYDYFTPVFFYEFLWGVAFALVLLWLHKRTSPNPLLRKEGSIGHPPLAKGRREVGSAFRPGTIFALYLIFASLGRILVEFLRIDPVPIVFGIRLPLVVSSLLIVVGALILARKFGKVKSEIQ